MKLVNRGLELFSSEFRPREIGEEQLRVRGFPQHKIRKPMLAAGSYKEVDLALRWRGGIGNRNRRQGTREVFARRQPSGRQPGRGTQNGIAGGVVDGDSHRQAPAERGRAFDSTNFRAQIRRQPIAAADHYQMCAAVDETPRLGPEIAAQHPHQRLDLVARTQPVVGGKSEQSENLDTAVGSSLDHAAHGLDTGAMACGARQASPDGPASIAIHDERNVKVRIALQSTWYYKVIHQEKSQA